TGRYPVGLLLQDPNSQTILARCGDDLAFGLENLGVPRADIWPRVREAADCVGFGYPLSRSTAALSGGERQRLALAGVLALQPGLLLLDEPTAMLDPAGADLLRHSVRRLLRDTATTCLVVEHRVDPWLQLLDRVIVLGPEGVLADGPIRQTLAAHARELTEAGVWLPTDLAPRRTPVRLPTAGPELLVAEHDSGAQVRLAAGRALGITGPNGSGKTTWAMQLAGLSAPKSPLRVTPELARGATGPAHRWSAKQLITRIGTVFQWPQVQFVRSTVQAELALGPERAGPPMADMAPRPSPDELLQRLGLRELAAAHPATLSGGEQRRLSVATALATAPSLLVLDEPTFGQDRRTWDELVGLLGELLTRGVAVLAITHDPELLAALGAEHCPLPAPVGDRR
ncbi:MAG: ATP-binding cassette domain-containing protein, partial [Angustibacter sp.]